MTESDFLRQVWRAYDSVELDNGIKGRVINVCFPTRSVRVNLPTGGAEWFRFDMIVEHKSATGEPDDISIIADLHNRLMKAEQKNENLQKIIDEQKDKLGADPNEGLSTLRKSLNEIDSSFVVKKKRLEKIDKAIERINTWLDSKGVPPMREEER